jgi:hypothetical protein
MVFLFSFYTLRGQETSFKECDLKTIFFLFLGLALGLSAFADTFESEAQQLAQDLKMNLVKNLTQKIEKEGVVKAIPFCHENVKPIAKESAGERVAKFEFGRTSHKVRNQMNRPAFWAESYLKEFQGKLKSDITKNSLLIEHEGKRIYLEPLFVEAKCLLCHGDKLSPQVSEKIKSLYPQDQAIGFKQGEFRGFIWVKEK